tara:strand:- start:341 stop:985 length:645 start_codon:yes stop_codon:yes gene_type:complete
MEIDNFTKLILSNQDVTAFKTKLNILKNNEIIFPHEETVDDNRITSSIIKNSVIVLGVIFESFEDNLVIKDQIFILDGHHRYQYIKNNSIDDLFEVVLVSMSDIKIESHNSELLVDDDIFVNKIMIEKDFSLKENSKYFISLNNKKFFSKNISNISALYSYKKQLLKELVISPIKNNELTDKSLVKFTPLTQKNFSKNYIFPYKSTWITPRFDI